MSWRYRTIDCIKRWFWVAHPGKAEIVRATIPACIRAGALALPLALPGAAFVPAVGGVPVALPGAALTGPAFAPYDVGGALFVPGVFGISPQGARSQLAVNAVGGHAPTEIGDHGARPITEGGSPITTYAAPHDVPVWVPGQDTPPTDVPEPSTFWLLLAGLGLGVAWMLIKTGDE